MKNSYIEDEEVLQTPSRKSHDFAVGMNGSIVLAEPTILPQSNSENLNNEYDDHHHSTLGDAESRALVPPLEVPLDDIEGFDVETGIAQGVVNPTTADTTEDKTKKKAKKKAREER